MGAKSVPPAATIDATAAIRVYLNDDGAGGGLAHALIGGSPENQLKGAVLLAYCACVYWMAENTRCPLGAGRGRGTRTLKGLDGEWKLAAFVA
jgi:hypothetical protein